MCDESVGIRIKWLEARDRLPGFLVRTMLPSERQSQTASLNVLHVCAGKLFGGVERYLLTLFEHRGLCLAMVPHFAVSYEGELSKRLRELGADVTFIGPTRFARPWTIWATRRRVGSLIKAKRIDVTVSHACWPHAVLARTPPVTVIYMHDAVRGKHWLEKKAMRVPARLAIANSRYTASQLPRHSFGNAAVTRLTYPSWLPNNEQASTARQQLRACYATPEDTVVIVLTSRWEPYKGHELLVESLGKLKTAVPWALWIAGGTQRPHEEAFRKKVLSNAQRVGVLNRIRLLGQRSDVATILASADIHCQPNIAPEPFGLTFVEALAQGLTVVTTRQGGGEEILSPDFGLLTTPGDAIELAGALKRVIESPELRANFAVKGPKRARQLCDPSTQLNALFDALRLTTLSGS